VGSNETILILGCECDSAFPCEYIAKEKIPRENVEELLVLDVLSGNGTLVEYSSPERT
jgi:hypothetical protein